MLNNLKALLAALLWLTLGPVLLVVAVILVALPLFHIAFPPNVRVNKEATSPDGRYTATFYTVSGGGAAGYVVEYVSLRERGKAFRAHEGKVFEMGHAYEIDLSWKESRHLVVEYPDRADVHRAADNLGSVLITYVSKPTVDNYFLRSRSP